MFTTLMKPNSINLFDEFDRIFNYPNSFNRRNTIYLKENVPYVLTEVENTHFKLEKTEKSLIFNIVKPWSVKEDFQINVEEDILKIEYKANPSTDHYIKLFEYKISNIDENKEIKANHVGSQLIIEVPINDNYSIKNKKTNIEIK